jgi:hypothetical protein
MSFLLAGVLIVSCIACLAVMISLYVLERDARNFVPIRISRRS